MRITITACIAAGLVIAAGNAAADEHASGEGLTDPATPIEMFACVYNDGKGPADLDATVVEWNKWADRQEISDYSAWTLVPYYFGRRQEFDLLWIGGSPSGKALGRAQDRWLATGASVQRMFDDVVSCFAHANAAVLEYKAPPERENPANIVISMADCNMHEGVSFGDIAPALSKWSAWEAENGSTAGIWVFFPAYGGGAEEFDFKYVTAHQNLEDQGFDWDLYSKSGWAVADELFAGKLNCDASRVYVATNRRMAEDGD